MYIGFFNLLHGRLIHNLYEETQSLYRYRIVVIVSRHETPGEIWRRKERGGSSDYETH